MKSTQPQHTSSNAWSAMALLQMATWTDEAFETFPRPISTAIRNATSSPEAVSGPLQLDLPGGLTSDPSGPDPAPARAKASPAKGSEPMIQGICGRTFFGSSVPDGPLSSWENRLRQRLARIGSTESALIWRTKTTPCGRSISRLAPSMRHTNGNDCTGSRWTTVSARDWKDSTGMAVTTEDGRSRLDQLPRQMISYSPTPRASDGEKGGPNMSFGAGGVPLPAVMHSYNPTPTVADVQGGRKARSGARGGEPLLNGLMVAYAPTPTSLSFKDSHQPGNSRSLNLMRAHFAMDHGGPAPNGSSALSTEKRGAPNPEFPFWLMGFPDEWVFGALAAMRSYRSSRRK